MNNELIKINNNVLVGDETIQTVNARELHGFLGVGRDFSTWIKSQIDRARLVEDRDYVILEDLRSPISGSTKARTQKIFDYHLSLDAAKHIAMVSGCERGYEVREYFIECERKLKTRTQQDLGGFQIPATMAEALRLAADLSEQNTKITYERDEAVRTKAHISDKKTAAAMGTASAAVRRAKKLEEKLGIAEDWKQVRAIEWLHEVFDFKVPGVWVTIGLQLKDISEQLGLKIRKTPSSRYGTVNVYHSDAIETFYELIVADPEYLLKYRKADLK